jgi:hypothetical protein
MHRTIVVAALSILALASSGRTVLAQERALSEEPATRDSVAPSPVDAGPVVDTSSHKWTGTRRDRLLAGCVGRGQSPVNYLLPLICIQRADGQVDIAQFDTAVFVRYGREYHVAVRNVGGIPLLNRQQKSHALSGALIGGGLGFATAAFASIHGNGGFGSTALILGSTGAVIGAFSGSKYLTDWPRVLRENSHSQ